MNLTHALHAIGGTICTTKVDGKSEVYVVKLESGYKDTTDMVMLAMAYTTIAEHLEVLNEDNT